MKHRVPQRKRKASKPEDARIVRSRDQLRAALLALIETKSFDEITIRDIAAEADVGYTTYFRHYPSKEALLDDIAVAEIGRLCELTMPVYDTGDSRAACLTLCAFVDEHRALWAALLTGGAAGLVRAEFLRQTQAHVATLGVVQSWMPQDLSNLLAISSIMLVLTWWLQQEKPVPVARAADILNRIVIAPAAATAAPRRPAKRAASRRRPGG